VAKAQTFVDWVDVDTTLGTATGTLASAQVTISGPCGIPGPVSCGIYDAAGEVGGYTGFSDAALFATPVAQTDYVGFVGGFGNNAPLNYDVSFSTPVTSLVILIENLASTLVFTLPAGATLSRLSGDPTTDNRTFTVTGTIVVGTLVDCPRPCRVDAAGELRINGTVSGFSFTARYDVPGSPGNLVDGINLQIGGTVAAPVDAGVSEDASADAGVSEDASADAGVSEDASADAGELDAGLIDDAGALPDSGLPDSGSPADSGSVASDAGASDSGLRDTGSPQPDAGARPDTGLTDSGTTTEKEGGCGCASTRSPGVAWANLALPLLALAISRRKRRTLTRSGQ
jgi:MYXO-CTERM domain-containing protein